MSPPQAAIYDAIILGYAQRKARAAEIHAIEMNSLGPDLGQGLRQSAVSRQSSIDSLASLNAGISANVINLSNDDYDDKATVSVSTSTSVSFKGEGEGEGRGDTIDLTSHPPKNNNKIIKMEVDGEVEGEGGGGGDMFGSDSDSDSDSEDNPFKPVVPVVVESKAVSKADKTKAAKATKGTKGTKGKKKEGEVAEGGLDLKNDVLVVDLDLVKKTGGRGVAVNDAVVKSLNELSSKEAKNLFTALRKAANHPLLLRIRFRDPIIIDQIAHVAVNSGHFGKECDVPRAVTEINASFSDFDLHQMCLEYHFQLGKYILPEESLYDSAKFRYLAKRLPELISQGHHILIFSQWTRILDLLECLLNTIEYQPYQGIPYVHNPDATNIHGTAPTVVDIDADMEANMDTGEGIESKANNGKNNTSNTSNAKARSSTTLPADSDSDDDVLIGSGNGSRGSIKSSAIAPSSVQNGASFTPQAADIARAKGRQQKKKVICLDSSDEDADDEDKGDNADDDEKGKQKEEAKEVEVQVQVKEENNSSSDMNIEPKKEGVEGSGGSSTKKDGVKAVKGIPFLRLDGSTPVKDRQALIDTYNKGKTPVFLLSTKAGGLGINLCQADTVILHDLDFNPENDRQAEDRAHRIGQARAVTVVKLVTNDTVDRDIYDMGVRKRILSKALLTDEGTPQKEEGGGNKVIGKGEGKTSVGAIGMILQKALLRKRT